MHKPHTVIFDVESDGLLDELTRIHCLVIKDYERGTKHRFRRNEREDTIAKGVAMLQDAELVVGHNILGFDLKAIEKVYPGFEVTGRIYDTLVMARVQHADIKEDDFRWHAQFKAKSEELQKVIHAPIWRAGEEARQKRVTQLQYAISTLKNVPGQMIGRHTLDAWGHRLGLHKGDYKKEMEAKAKAQGITDPREVKKFVWGTWNEEMEDYCDLDVDVTETVFTSLINGKHDWSGARQLEHQIHDLMMEQEREGIYFDMARAEVLLDELEKATADLEVQIKKNYGYWFAPAKKNWTRHQWHEAIEEVTESEKKKLSPLDLRRARREAYRNASTGSEKKKVDYYKPDASFGETGDQAFWGEVTVPKRSRKVKDIKGVTECYTKDEPYCKIKQIDFNPYSRAHIADRLHKYLDWSPKSVKGFTESGNPVLNDKALRKLVDELTLSDHDDEDADPLDDVDEVEFTSFAEAVGQQPLVVELADLFYYKKRIGALAAGKNAWMKKAVGNDEDGWKIHGYVNVGGAISGRATHSSPNLAQVPKVKFSKDKKPLFGRAGDHGADCRRLFTVPDGWQMTGSDLSGIELRCFAEQLLPFGGEDYMQLILNGDIHTYNQKAAGLPTRDNAKTFIYACVPMDTEALTSDGWKTYSELRVGDMVETYNYVTDAMEYKPILEKVFYPDAEMLTFGNHRNFRVRCTPNHRWFTTNGVRTAEELQDDAIIVDARGFYNTTFSMSGVVKTRLPNQPVWCIRTENESWVMRQGNTITITGNTLYGAGDAKIGSIVAPFASEEEQRAIGKRLKENFKNSVPAFAEMMEALQVAMTKSERDSPGRPYLIGLDGRKLFVRSPHSALNTLLQSDAALIAKKWVLLTYERLLNEGWESGWNGDFTQLLWVHDETQIAFKGPEKAFIIEEHAKAAAIDAGKFFGYECPIAADAKSGFSWLDTH